MLQSWKYNIKQISSTFSFILQKKSLIKAWIALLSNTRMYTAKNNFISIFV